MSHESESAAIIRHIASLKLTAALQNIPTSTIAGLKKVVWGAGVSGKSFVQMNDFLDFAYIVDGRERLQGTTFENLQVHPPEVLMSENRDEVCIFLPTVIAAELYEMLQSEGFRHIIIPNHINTSGLQIAVPRSDIHLVFEEFSREKVDYAVLRWTSEPLEGLADIDLMAESSPDNLRRLMQASSVWTNRSGGSDHDSITLDIKFSAPVGLNNELPYFPLALTQALFANGGTKIEHGLRVPSDQIAVYTYLYHILFQKAEKSGLKNESEGVTNHDLVNCDDADNKYLRVISDLSSKTGKALPRDLRSIWDWLRTSDFPPPLDYARKWARESGSLLLQEITKHRVLEKDNVAVFIFREWFRDHPEVIEACTMRLEVIGFRKMSIHVLSEERKKHAAAHIRGGVWGETHSSIIGGKPYAAGVFMHDGYAIVQKAKEVLRDYVSDLAGREINAIHSSDDHQEALEYLDVIGCDPEGFNSCLSQKSQDLNIPVI